MDIAVEYVIVPRKHLYWVEAVDRGGSRRVIEVFRDEGAAVERSLQSQKEKMELRWDALRGLTVPCGWLSWRDPRPCSMEARRDERVLSCHRELLHWATMLQG
jgi:hypothetical protein